MKPEIGTIIAISEGRGSYSVKLPGRNNAIDGVPALGKLSIGARVPVGRIRNKRQLPIILAGKRDPRRQRQHNPYPAIISSLNWPMWRNAQYRGRYNKTNQYPNLSLSEHVVYEYTDGKSFCNSIVHEGYIYSLEPFASHDYRLVRVSLTDGLKTYATYSGTAMENGPWDLVILEESGVPYAYIIHGYSYWHYIAKYNLNTMTRVYMASFTAYNGNWHHYTRLFYDATNMYEVGYNGTPVRYDNIRSYNRETGATSIANFAWPTIDFQTNNGYLCLPSEIRSDILTLCGNGVIFPTMFYSGTSNIIYEVPAFNLDGTLKWNYKPTSKTITKQWFSYVKEWYSTSITSNGIYFDLTYNTTNTLYNFGIVGDGEKQIRNTLIACNNTYAIVLSEETTVKKNDTYKAYDDWQQTVWKDSDWPTGFCAYRYIANGQGSPGMTTDELDAILNQCFGSFDSLAFDEDYLNFSWIDRKEVFLRVLNVNTGELVTEYGFSASESDTGGSDDLVINKNDLITGIRVCSHSIFIDRTKEDYVPYSGDSYETFMGIEADEVAKNGVMARILDFWVADWDPETPYEYFWCGGWAPTGLGNAIVYDELGNSEQCYQLGIQGAGLYNSEPTGPGTWHYKCVAVKHPTTDVTFHTKKYIPTKYDFTKTLMTDTRLFVAPSGASGRLGCFTITSPATLNWSLDVGPGAEFLHFLCNENRLYYFRGTDRTNCILYEINISTGTILTTKTGMSVCSSTGGMEPLVINNKLVLIDSYKASYYGE